VVYLQLPAADVAASAAFYQAVFGWSVDPEAGRFEAPGIIGEWTTERPPARDAGPVAWILADQLWPVLQRVGSHGGRVAGRPALDDGERYLVECDDPAGNRIGVAVPVRRLTQPQTLIAVRDVEASSQWYQRLLGLRSDHGGATYERLADRGTLVLQLHCFESGHHHGAIGDPGRDLGNGVVLWFGETADFDGVVARAADLGAAIVLPPLRNPAEGDGNGPGHREIWLKDPDGYTVVVASPDGEAFEPASAGGSQLEEAEVMTDDGEAILAGQLLRSARSVLVIDWPSRDVPESLAQAGLEVFVRSGPGTANHNRYHADGDQIVVRPAGNGPAQVDLVYCHRPVSELPGIAGLARSLGARAVWRQSGLAADGVRDPAGTWVPEEESQRAHAIVEASGLAYIEALYIVDAVAAIRRH
jgi:predicted enzyme related to lactoylglutathione lyase